MIVSDDVVWMSQPNATRVLVGVEHTPRLLGIHDKVLSNTVVNLRSICVVDAVTKRIVQDIASNLQVLRV